MVFRDKTQYIIYMIAVLLVADFIWFGFLPSRQRLEALQQSRRRQTTAVSRARDIARQIPSLKMQIQVLEKRLQRWRQYVPPEREMAQFLEDTAAIMTRYGLTDQAFVPGLEVSMEGLFCIPVSIHCRGTLSQLFSFYRDLHSQKRLIRFEKVNLQRNRAASGGHIRMQTDILIFYRPTESTIQTSQPSSV